jgi:hypothetical protein
VLVELEMEELVEKLELLLDVVVIVSSSGLNVGVIELRGESSLLMVELEGLECDPSPCIATTPNAPPTMTANTITIRIIAEAGLKENLYE